MLKDSFKPTFYPTGFLGLEREKLPAVLFYS